ncbi:F-box domain-containing protein [Artemisia annua]|uniref:F-box domain-containing protein n=1 Tax=Artemisia annua TaxID=35608 RepID=A0A2U1PG45_ARTAN|nr:F-box domain-containing protein [Artemisia annua]
MDGNRHIPDDILHNILARLPGKPLLRFRCVSTHWNRLISDPYFMKSRSRRMIMLKYPSPLAVIDANVPVDDKAHSMVKVPSLLDEYNFVSMVGTFNGIVILVLIDMSLRSHMILYNPLTRASKTLDVMDPQPPGWTFRLPHRYGFDTNDLQIVRFVECGHPPGGQRFKCDVFDLKTSSWSKSPHYLKKEFFFWGDGGVFLNGCLYWTISLMNMGIIAFNIKEMAFSHITLPHGYHSMEIIPITRRITDCQGAVLGSLDGRGLCLITKDDTITFNVWVMNKPGVENLWLKTFTFTLGIEGDRFYEFHPMCILDKGIILLRSKGSHQLVTYDMSKDTFRNLNGLASLDDFEDKDTMHCDRIRIHPIEYVESLVSPSDICVV